MPKIYGVNILFILLAGFLFFLLGWLWYGMLFSEAWMALTGMTEEMAEQNMGLSMTIGLLISILQAIGIAAMMGAANLGLTKGLKAGAHAWLLFALPLMTYAWNYENKAVELLQIDSGYMIVGYLIMGAVIGLTKK